MKWSKLFKLVFTFILVVVGYCEFFVYYVVLGQCKWPTIPSYQTNLHPLVPVKALIIADTHLLGPLHGHWFDKLFREWHMHRAFQTAITVFRPEVIFVLGDVFDEGHMVNDEYFGQYVYRYHSLFYTPKNTRIISVVGNHDVGFHYRMHPFFLDRFKEVFNNTGVELYTIRDVHFVVVNSMAMENDKCELCDDAQKELNRIGTKLMCLKHPDRSNCPQSDASYSRPILMQHFPTYRVSDAVCEEHDTPKIQRYKENWDVLSIESTHNLGKVINPRLAFSGHTHHYCKLRNRLGIVEYSSASFSWRNKINPSFLLAEFTATDHGVSKCDMPVQSTNVTIYISALAVCATVIVLNLFPFRRFAKLRKEN